MGRKLKTAQSTSQRLLIRSVPPLSVCLRTLSRRRTQSASLSRVSMHRAVLGPESFRGGCSFGAGFLRALPHRRRRQSPPVARTTPYTILFGKSLLGKAILSLFSPADRMSKSIAAHGPGSKPRFQEDENSVHPD